MDRTNHYEAAFEAFLRTRCVPYVAVDEGRRALLAGESLKSLDFIIALDQRTLLVDVKGRRFPSGRRRQYWKNWSTRDDLVGLAHWQERFGPRSQGLFVFAYELVADRAPLPAPLLFEHRGRRYGFVGVPLSRYVCWARPLSPRWDTVALPLGRFREVAEPIQAFLES